jgi:serine/threonine protein kinase
MTEKTLSLKFNVPIFKMDLLSANWEKVMAKNENFKLYDGVYEGLGPCSILIMYNIERHIDAFYKVATQINIFSNMSFTYLAKLFGIIVDREKFCLIFERLSCSLEARLITKSMSDKERYTAMLEVIETVLFLHENKLRAYDLRPSNIFMNEGGDVRMIFPLGKIY